MKNWKETTHQEALDILTWSVLAELNFKKILNSVNVDQVFDVIYKFLENKIKDNLLSVKDVEEIADNIREKAKVLFDLALDGCWERGDDGCHDIATAAVAFGKANYEKCLKDHEYLKSMREETREYENVLYPFNEIVEKYKNN